MILSDDMECITKEERIKEDLEQYIHEAEAERIKLGKKIEYMKCVIDTQTFCEIPYMERQLYHIQRTSLIAYYEALQSRLVLMRERLAKM